MNTIKVDLLTYHQGSDLSYYAELELPCSNLEIKDALQRCRANEKYATAYFLQITNCEAIPDLAKYELLFDDINNLNYLAQRISNFDNSEIAIYNALLPNILKDGKYFKVKDLINLTFSLDNCVVAANINNFTDLGRLLLDNDMLPELYNLSDEILQYISPEVIGREQAKAEGGKFINGYYIETSTFKLAEEFNGVDIPENKDNSVFRINLSPYNSSNNEILQTPLIVSIPFAKSEINRIAEYFEELELEEDSHFLLRVRSSIPSFNDYDCFDFDYLALKDFIMLNKLANEYLSLTEEQQTIYKAILEKEEIQSIRQSETALRHINAVDNYILNAENVYASDFGEDYLLKHLDKDFPLKYLNTLPTALLGEAVLKNLNAVTTHYGILVPSSAEQTLAETENQEIVMGGIS